LLGEKQPHTKGDPISLIESSNANLDVGRGLRELTKRGVLLNSSGISKQAGRKGEGKATRGGGKKREGNRQFPRRSVRDQRVEMARRRPFTRELT